MQVDFFSSLASQKLLKHNTHLSILSLALLHASISSTSLNNLSSLTWSNAAHAAADS